MTKNLMNTLINITIHQINFPAGDLGNYLFALLLVVWLNTKKLKKLAKTLKSLKKQF